MIKEKVLQLLKKEAIMHCLQIKICIDCHQIFPAKVGSRYGGKKPITQIIDDIFNLCNLIFSAVCGSAFGGNRCNHNLI